jgi:DNA repair protein RecN (Recombination protein N)
LDLLGSAAGALDDRSALSALDERIRAAQAELSDVASELRTVVETWEDDPGQLEAVQSRRRQLADLYRKYGGDRVRTLAFLAAARDRRERLNNADTEALALDQDRRAAQAELEAAEAALLEARSATAPTLASSVMTRLSDLAMAGSRFQIEVEETGAGEGVTFLLGANAGESMRPLAKAASGGELARVMLALRLVAPGGPQTMVFDEVDAGVGGTAALALARSLREVAEHRQVLVVTHLAQVAAFASHQVSVQKIEAGGRVVTGADAVTGEARVVEISRMLSGHPDSLRAQAHARELLDLETDAGSVVGG